MGAPKQKWTSEEEEALKAGVVKHGAGKWRTILKDPEYSNVLYLRSNVDLKDKWRNMSVTANGWGSREKARLALKRSQHMSRHDDNPMALSTVVETTMYDEIVDAKPLAISGTTSQITGLKGSISRLEDLILEAITNLKEPSGSNKTAIASYIEDQYSWTPPDFKRLLSAKLKALTASRKLIKVNRKYRIAPSLSGLLLLEGRQYRDSISTKVEKEDFKAFSKSQIDAELAKIRNMSTVDAAFAAAKAVAEAELAMAEAEEALREYEEAEADAVAAQAFKEAAKMTLESRNASKMMVRA
eukprot:TRINITY_DN3849_c0_g1_i1.p1 TRINITY_DN3849_c0_g1~~TRINITY_DN3849_c0_g1_i1.p1  ORF type:complete len:299 (-),score=71.83 TRINITY_DN3849_c0_g1_i1:17-913(-)